ncbi:hypothetical protein [Cronobacter dublinensis]|uniref:hypothetical protein n=1 Tax=Cronobacter dublinensis TaxID=413497 RepID=UPI000CFCCAD2|nr:hypothetical protein [Cronobacter dublinensis]
MKSGYLTWLKNTFRWGYRLTFKQLVKFIMYSALMYCLLLGAWFALLQIMAFTPLIEYVTADQIIQTSFSATRVIQALVGIPVVLHAIKSLIWLFTAAPHGHNGDTSYYTDTTHHLMNHHATSGDTTTTHIHSSHHGSYSDNCSSDSGSGGDSGSCGGD